MVLVCYGESWTLLKLCLVCFICNVVTLKGFVTDEKKDLVFVSDGRVFEKQYRFEDFFWTGSEDSFEKENTFKNETETELNLIEATPLGLWRTTTVFHTTTILFATVYPNTDSCNDQNHGCTPQVSPIQTRSIEFSMPTTFDKEESEILPCPTQKVPVTDFFDFPSSYPEEDENFLEKDITTSKIPRPSTKKPPKTVLDFPKPEFNDQNSTNTTVFPLFPLDQKYWIMTVLRSDNTSQNLEVNLTENKLTSLYKKALVRREEKYFGGIGFFDRRDRKLAQPVKANILNVTRNGKNLEIIYYVSVAGEPVPAMTAANDMRLMTASEVIAELGYPILSKAEPYIKHVVPLGARVNGRTRDTWLFVGCIIAAVLLLMILATLLALLLSKKQNKQNQTKESSHRKSGYEGREGSRNFAFEADDEAMSKSKISEGSISKRKDLQSVRGTSVKFTTEGRRGSTTSSSCSGSSEASLVRLRHQQRKNEKRLRDKEEKPKPKPRTRIRKIDNSECCKNHERHVSDRVSSAISQNTYNEISTEGGEHYSPSMARSPTSYLSMPSVKAFPRGAQIPEPLNKVLEPISIRHLDADSDSQNEYGRHSSHKVDVEQICEVKNKYVRRKTLTRHASLEGDDPGFIGPVVWNRHIRKIGETDTFSNKVFIDGINLEEIEEDEDVSVGKMRKRFNELLDDALSMFGSRNPSPEGNENSRTKQSDNRVHSAVVRPAGLLSDTFTGARPKTTGSRRPHSSVMSAPRGAWETPSCSTLGHTDTTITFQKLSPTIDKDLINVNSELGPGDPAVPLIAAIKNELKKFEEPQCPE